MVAIGQIKRTTGPQIGTPDETPTWRYRSVLSLHVGRWRMRNGHTADVQRKKVLTYLSGQTDNAEQPRKERSFTVWYGLCVECNEPLGFNANGTYAAVGTHGNDIIGRVD